MGILENMNKKVRKFSIVDVKLVQGVGIFVAFIIAKLIPQILDINIWWFVALLLLCAIRPMYVFFLKKERRPAKIQRKNG